MSRKDRMIAFVGFGTLYFKVKSWSEVNQSHIGSEGGIYTKLAIKHKIWVIMFETFPSLVLQIYASFVQRDSQLSLTLISSITFSLLHVILGVWQYVARIGADINTSDMKWFKTKIELEAIVSESVKQQPIQAQR